MGKNTTGIGAVSEVDPVKRAWKVARQHMLRTEDEPPPVAAGAGTDIRVAVRSGRRKANVTFASASGSGDELLTSQGWESSSDGEFVPGAPECPLTQRRTVIESQGTANSDSGGHRERDVRDLPDGVDPGARSEPS